MVQRGSDGEPARQAADGDAERLALLNALVENAPDFIVHVDRARTIRFINRIAPNIPLASVIGQNWLVFIADEHRATAAAALDHTLTTGELSSYEIMGQGPDGMRLYWSRVAPVRRDGEIVGAVVVARDVTEQKKAETQLIAAERMASVGVMAAGVAHEINNPLAAVIANLELLQECVPRSPAVDDALADARAGADRVRQIVRELRIFSRADTERRMPLSLHEVLDATLRLAWNEVRHRARLVKEYAPVPAVIADETRLGQVFLNLVVNAAQAIVEGNAAGNEIRVGTSVDSRGRVVVHVADSGPGMSPETLARLFTPFFTTKPAGVGTGLGLTICQRIVTGFGGEITVQSEPGRGTVVRVALPAAEEIVDSPAAASPRPVPLVGRANILVIDDDPLVITAIKRILGREHEVTAVDSARAAQALLGAGQRYDVILCDLMMPQVTGMDFFHALERSQPDQAARVVFVTGGAFTPGAREFLDAVTNPRLDKPFDSLALKALVARCMERTSVTPAPSNAP